eukprot:gene21599-22509_t
MAWPLAAICAVLAMVCAAATALSEEPPRADFGRWAVKCDANACRASLPSASGNEALLIARWAGSDGLSIGFATPRTIADRDRPIDLHVDGARLLVLAPSRDYAPLERDESFWLTAAKPAGAVLQAILRAKLLRIAYLDVIGAPHDADFTLDQFARVLDEFDLRQGKSGTPRQAAAPPASLSPPPSLPRADLVARMGVPDRLLQRHRAASDCEDPASPLLKPIAPVIGALSKTAYLYAVPCVASAGNVAYKLWVIETGEIGGITPLFFAAYDGTFGWRGTDLLFNVTFDAASARLTSQFKNRPDGACGNRGVWRWRDFAFSMEEFRLSGDCGTPRPATEFPRIFPPK